ncbi:MAG TPA: tetratricopeptide repeat protein [bacterium (Candidatus Stahlbacteria)]|nr:tetratricopeptide repeat protein [Candidatus Stahlbacteria bacterium]
MKRSNRMKEYGSIIAAENAKEEEDKLRSFVSAHPEDLVAGLRLGDIMREKGAPERALRLHRPLLAHTKLPRATKKRVYRSIVKDYVALKEYEAAIDAAKKLLKLDNRDLKSYELLCFIYEESGKWKEAIDVREKIARLTKKKDDKNLAILHSFLGKELCSQAKNREGLTHLRLALKLDENCVPALLFFGEITYKDGNPSEGMEYWHRLLKTDYAFLAFDKLEKAYYEQQTFSEAERMYTSFLDERPDDIRALFKLSEIYERKGQLEDAIGLLSRIKEIDPNNVSARKGLIKLYLEMQQYDEVAKEVDEIGNLLEEHEPYRCSNCGFKLKEFEFRCPQCKSWMTVR